MALPAIGAYKKTNAMLMAYGLVLKEYKIFFFLSDKTSYIHKNSLNQIKNNPPKYFSEVLRLWKRSQSIFWEII